MSYQGVTLSVSPQGDGGQLNKRAGIFKMTQLVEGVASGEARAVALRAEPLRVSSLCASIANAWFWNDILAVIADMNPHIKRNTIEGRLKNMKQLGLLPHAKTGKGVPYIYTNADVIFLSLICELSELGMTPKAAANLLEGNDWLDKWSDSDAMFRPDHCSASYIVLDFGRLAKAMEARRATTSTGVVHESAVRQDAPEGATP